MTAIDRDAVKIWIVPVGTNASTLLLDGTTALAPILGEIKNYNKSGGERDVETDPHFGGMVTKKTPIAQVELSFEITPSLEHADRWNKIAYGSAVGDADLSVMNVAPVDKTVFIQGAATAGTISYAFNNCSVTLLDMEHAAEDNQTMNLTLKFSPETIAGKTNFMSKKLAVTGLPAWGTH